MSTICVFGDSIAWGASDYEGGGWVAKLKRHFESEGLRVDLDTDVYNLGISGDNTGDLLKRFFVEAEAREPDTVIFAIGINDSQFVLSAQSNRVSLDAFRANLSEMISDTILKERKVYILGLTRVDEAKTTPIPWNTDKEYRNEYIEKYDNVLKELAAEHGVTYIDVLDTLETDDLHDGLHPNASGHQKIFEVVKAKLS
jgi:lysophospholipase L1-like esterase